MKGKKEPAATTYNRFAPLSSPSSPPKALQKNDPTRFLPISCTITQLYLRATQDLSVEIRVEIRQFDSGSIGTKRPVLHQRRRGVLLPSLRPRPRHLLYDTGEMG